MATELSRPWMRRNGLPIHVGLALPWAVNAGAILVLASTGDAMGPIGLSAVPSAATSVALLLTRRWWVVIAAIVGAVASFAGAVGIGLNYIDHSPSSKLAQSALDVTNVSFLVGVVACVAAIVVGVLEWRARGSAESRPA